jgi:hypothetical protein
MIDHLFFLVTFFFFDGTIHKMSFAFPHCGNVVNNNNSSGNNVWSIIASSSWNSTAQSRSFKPVDTSRWSNETMNVVKQNTLVRRRGRPPKDSSGLSQKRLKDKQRAIQKAREMENILDWAMKNLSPAFSSPPHSEPSWTPHNEDTTFPNLSLL